MIKVSMRSNIKEVAAKLAKDIKRIENAKQIALGEVVKEAFQEIERKYVITGDTTNGDRYKPTSRGDLSRYQKTRKGEKKLSVGKYFDSKKIITRSGDLLDSIKTMATSTYTAIGTVRSENYMVKITKNKVELWAMSTKAIVLEVKAAGNKGARNIIRKTFSAAVRIYNKAFQKANK